MGEVRFPEFTDDNFSEAVQGDLPVVVDFFAESCIPCRKQLPSIEQLAKTTEGRLHVGRFNVDQNPETPRQLLIKGVPHLIVVNEGEVVLEMVGSHSYDQLVSRLRSVDLL